jgi:hypothetical protein
VRTHITDYEVYDQRPHDTELLVPAIETHEAKFGRAPRVARASWLNEVECGFSILQEQSLGGASFTSVEQLREHIDVFVEIYNKTAKPFVWIKLKVYQRRVNGRRLSHL